MKYYVNGNASEGGDGSRDKPFKKIQEAAKKAAAGDEVIVAPGIYRESVSPVNGGREDARIVYRTEVERAAIITGAEPVTNWEACEGTVWKARISNTLFGDYNPYTTLVYGDWFVASMTAHTGDVYLNGKSMYEVTEFEKVRNPQPSPASWDPAFSVYVWYTVQDENACETILYANFQGLNPNEETVEISVRRTCFHPEKEGVNYITLSGFTVRQAATQWAPPTAYQEGMIGPHWSKGWIIEDCEIYESKCSGISLGKYLQPENDNKWSRWKYKDGTQTERDCICQAQREGWSKERIGSHTVRRCDIHDCGQTGIVGHLGGVFSVIEDNKIHAAIDVIIRRNHIYRCTRGLWLDWQAQGTRVTGNLFFDNCLPEAYNHTEGNEIGEDIFIEVSHGPTLIDHNVLLSDCALKLATQGVALVHNLIAGSFTAVGRGVLNGALTRTSPRYTPYHVPHRTEIAGFMTILHGDMRFYNNIFIQKELRPALKRLMDARKEDEWTDGNLVAGTVPYEDYPTLEEYQKQFEGYCGMGSAPSDRYYNPLPVWAEGNVYFNGAKPMSKEKASVNESDVISVCVEETEEGFFLRTDLYDYMPETPCRVITTDVLGMAFEPEQKFENPDGSPIVFREDYYGNAHGEKPCAGPFAKSDSLKL